MGGYEHGPTSEPPEPREAGDRLAFGDEPVLRRRRVGEAQRHAADHALAIGDAEDAADYAMVARERHLRAGVQPARAPPP